MSSALVPSAGGPFPPVFAGLFAMRRGSVKILECAPKAVVRPQTRGCRALLTY